MGAAPPVLVFFRNAHQAGEGWSSPILRRWSGLSGALVGAWRISPTQTILIFCWEEGSKWREGQDVTTFKQIVSIKSIALGIPVISSAHAPLQSRPLKWAAGFRCRLFVRVARVTPRTLSLLHSARSFTDCEQPGICWLIILKALWGRNVLFPEVCLWE